LAAHQTFGVRIRQNRWETGSELDPERLEFYVGRLSGDQPRSLDVWVNEIKLAEKLLIHEHAPAYNSTHIMAIHNEAEGANVSVINFGAIRSLRREVSGYMGSPARKSKYEQGLHPK
jgi:hypothetical protein